MTVVALDFETANRSPDSACAIGLAFVEGGAVTRRFHTLVRPPELDFDPFHIRVHGIRPEDVLHAPSFAEVWRDIAPVFDGALVLAHNASFDMGVLQRTAARHGLALPRFRSFCTVAMARRLWPEEPSRKLSALAARFGIAFRHHDAGEDAFACAAIALEGVRHAGARDIGELAETSGLAKAVAAGAAPKAGGVAARALAARGAAATSRLRFRVAGSRGTPYEIEAVRGPRGDMRLACTCPASRFRSDCKHRAALRLGDLGAVVGLTPEIERELLRLFAAGRRGAA
ncbi:DNA polymerase III [Aureimonas flava]|uniref:DNA polymerase III n=1 Tax=Aureimonas flava TaxID=2320271 RepID=A0A3A1WHG9_9HYPH|nr:3'-5' exonuclease [Aureimonas flava]RIX98784.1 DNA polymerase III [Aureimonas flava]